VKGGRKLQAKRLQRTSAPSGSIQQQQQQQLGAVIGGSSRRASSSTGAAGAVLLEGGQVDAAAATAGVVAGGEDVPDDEATSRQVQSTKCWFVSVCVSMFEAARFLVGDCGCGLAVHLNKAGSDVCFVLCSLSPVCPVTCQPTDSCPPLLHHRLSYLPLSSWLMPTAGLLQQ
jgi:hypothetical protein